MPTIGEILDAKTSDNPGGDAPRCGSTKTKSGNKCRNRVPRKGERCRLHVSDVPEKPKPKPKPKEKKVAKESTAGKGDGKPKDKKLRKPRAESKKRPKSSPKNHFWRFLEEGEDLPDGWEETDAEGYRLAFVAGTEIESRLWPGDLAQRRDLKSAMRGKGFVAVWFPDGPPEERVWFARRPGWDEGTKAPEGNGHAVVLRGGQEPPEGWSVERVEDLDIALAPHAVYRVVLHLDASEDEVKDLLVRSARERWELLDTSNNFLIFTRKNRHPSDFVPVVRHRAPPVPDPMEVEPDFVRENEVEEPPVSEKPAPPVEDAGKPEGTEVSEPESPEEPAQTEKEGEVADTPTPDKSVPAKEPTPDETPAPQAPQETEPPAPPPIEEAAPPEPTPQTPVIIGLTPEQFKELTGKADDGNGGNGDGDGDGEKPSKPEDPKKRREIPWQGIGAAALAGALIGGFIWLLSVVTDNGDGRDIAATSTTTQAAPAPVEVDFDDLNERLSEIWQELQDLGALVEQGGCGVININDAYDLLNELEANGWVVNAPLWVNQCGDDNEFTDGDHVVNPPSTVPPTTRPRQGGGATTTSSSTSTTTTSAATTTSQPTTTTTTTSTTTTTLPPCRRRCGTTTTTTTTTVPPTTSTTTTTTVPPTTTTTTMANIAPIADAGSSQTHFIGDDGSPVSVTLDGTGSYDPDGGSIVHYTWTAGGQGGVNPADVARPTVTLSQGVYEFCLIVTDDEGSTSSQDCVTVYVIQQGGG